MEMRTGETMRATTMLAAGAAAFLSACATTEVEDAIAREPMIKPWGFPLENIDTSTRPGDDFFQYANGVWLANTEIPADRTGTGFAIEMRDRNDARIQEIVDAALASDAEPGSNEQKIRDLYRAFMDEEGLDAAGMTVANDDLARIFASRTHEDVARLLADPTLGVNASLAGYVTIDAKNPDAYVVGFTHAGLGLPNRDYYLEEDNERFAELRVEYKAHLARMMAIAEIEDPEAKAEAIYALEHAIAELHWPAAERRDATRTYNRFTVADLADYAPGFPWRAHLDAAGLGDVDEVVVREKEAFPGLAQLFAATPVETWNAYLAAQYLDNNAPYLPTQFYDEYFAFFGTALRGQETPRARDKRAIQQLNATLDQAVGQVYVERYLPPEAKAEMTEIFENIRLALGARIRDVTWMSEETKAAALEKLAAMNAKIAYPDVWQDFSALEISPDDLFGNIRRARAYEHQRDIDHLGRPVDKREWFTGPQTVNAFYSPTRNEAFIPAGYMQPPLFDTYADPAINYGAIGSIIGHEIGHGFDDQGSRYDARGELRDWWTDEDRANFDAAGSALAAQFDAYEPLEGMHVNGRLTLGENLGDLVGVLVAYDAYERSLDGAPSPVLDGFTGEQRVFLGRAQARRYMRREESVRQMLVSDPHSPMKYRVNGIVRNVDAWYDAFGVAPGDDMYLPPDERVRAW